MNILHTSDWHLGKRLMDRERLAEQSDALNEIKEICEREHVDLVLVAGDVFDTFLPPAEAEELFFRAVKGIAGEDRAVVLISGNHDDGVRLSASAPLAAENGVYIFGGKGQRFPVGGNRAVKAVEAGENYVVIQNAAGERVYINALPYPNEARLKEDKTEESYAEKTLRWIQMGDEAYDGSIPHILLSHLFVAGGKVSDSERSIDLGGARAVPLCNLPAFGYTALGHLHRRQGFASKNAHYSSSLLQYSFDEANTEKVVLLLKTEGTDVRIEKEIPIRSGKRLVRLEANDVPAALGLLRAQENKFIELTLYLDAPLLAAETQALREANEGLVSLNVHVKEGSEAEIVRRSDLSERELFEAFYRKQCGGKDPPEEITQEFLLLLKEGEQ